MSLHPMRDAIVAGPGTVSVWEMGEAAGNLADSADANPATTVVAGVRGEPALPPNGEGASMKLRSGSGEHADVPHAANLNVGDVFTIGAWVKLIALGAIGTVMSKGAGAWQLRISAANQLHLNKNNFGTVLTETGVLDLAAHWLVCAKNAGVSCKLWVDGVDLSGAITPFTMVNTVDPLGLGERTAFGDERINAWEQDAFISNAAWAQADVDTIWATRNTAPTSGAHELPLLGVGT